jgi:protein ImuB
LRDPNQFHETLARLGALLGPQRAGAPRLLPSYRPDAFEIDAERIARDAFDETEDQGRESSESAPPRPTCGLALRRFRPPLPATVELRADRPALLHSAAVRGPIARLDGPWKISGDWWDNSRWAREEWEAETRDGSLCRLIRQNDQWFVDGVFD